MEEYRIEFDRDDIYSVEVYDFKRSGNPLRTYVSADCPQWILNMAPTFKIMPYGDVPGIGRKYKLNEFQGGRDSIWVEERKK